MFPHYIIGPPQREEILREIKMKRFLNFYWSMPQRMNEWEENISFCSFWSCVPTFLWGRLHREKKDWEKKVFVCFHHYIIGPYNTERRSFVWERKIKFLNFYWSMPQWIFWEDNISFVVFGAVYRPSSRVDYTERRKTERKKFLYVFPITSSGHHREKKY